MKILSARDVLFIGFTCLYLFLVIQQDLYPFIDLPNHLAEVAVYQNQNVFKDFYIVSDALAPNSFHYYFCSLFDNVSTGNKVYYGFYVMFFLTISYFIIKQVNGNRWFVFLPFLVLFSYSVTFGFTGFTLGIPFVLLIYYMLRIQGLWAKLVIMVTLVLLFYAHLLCLLFALFLIGVYTCIMVFTQKIKKLKLLIGHAWPVIPSLLLVIVWQASSAALQTEESTSQFMVRYYTTDYLPQFYQRAKLLVYENFVLQEGYRGVLIALFFSGTIIAPWLICLSRKTFFKNVFAFFVQYPGEAAFLLVSFFCCFFLPSELPGQGILYQRFSVFMMLGVIFTGSINHRNSTSMKVVWILPVVVLIHFLLWWNYFTAFDKENEKFTPQFLSVVPDGKPMGGVMVNENYRGRPVYIHFPSYRIVWNKQIATTKFIDYRFGSIRRTASFDLLPEYQEWLGEKKRIPERYRSLPYLLLRGLPDNIPDHAREIATAGTWKIYRMN